MPSNIIDIQRVVTDWAWGVYDQTATKKQKKLKGKHFKKDQNYINVVIDWSEVKFRDETKWPRLAEDSFEPDDETENSSRVAGAEHASSVADTSKPHTNILFQTKFINNTKEDQEYTMRTDKTTRSSCSTTVESGYTKGYEMSAKLATPGEVFEANAGFSREFSLTNSDGETFEEELSWGVESQIRVKAGHIAEAQLVVNEKKYSGNFEIESKITGTVFVTFTNVRDNNAHLKTTSYEIDEIMNKYVAKERARGQSMDFIEVRDQVVHITTKGQCKFRFGVNQEVKVDQKPLNHGTTTVVARHK